jgi:hypothetical protein
MKTSVSVIALKAFDWKGEAIVPGQSVSLTPIDAIALARKRQVTLTKRKAKPEPPPAPEPEPVVEPAKRRYKRRDLQAEEITAVMPEAERIDEPAE